MAIVSSEHPQRRHQDALRLLLPMLMVSVRIWLPIDQNQARGVLVAALGVMTPSGGRGSDKAGQSPVRVEGGGRE